jgi:glycosyltransferase involved in cell wall biosynthesis
VSTIRTRKDATLLRRAHTIGDVTVGPLVTVITPAYNAARYLSETIESVLAQEYPNLEYLVLDDGSTDETAALAQRYGSRLRLESQENMGPVLAVNRGFELAGGEIVGVVSADDPLLPGAVSTAVEALSADSSLVGVYPDWEMIDEDGRVVAAIETDEFDYVDMLRRHHCVPGPGAFFRRSLAQRLGGRDPRFRYVHDFDFWLRAGLVGPLARVPAVLATFRVHSEQVGAEYGPRQAAEHIALVQAVYAVPELPPAVRRVRRAAFGSAYYIAGCVYGGGVSPRRLRYWLKAVAYDPRCLVRIVRDRSATIRRLLRGGKASPRAQVADADPEARRL